MELFCNQVLEACICGRTSTYIQVDNTHYLEVIGNFLQKHDGIGRHAVSTLKEAHRMGELGGHTTSASSGSRAGSNPAVSAILTNNF